MLNISVTLPVLKCLIFKLTIFFNPANIVLISVTLAVFQPVKLSCFNAVSFENIPDILVTLLVSKLLKSKLVKLESPKNIAFIF